MTLKEAYNKIKELNCNVDSFEVVNEVDKYRNYWKPKKANVILLAESHVFTSDDDFKIKINYSNYKDLIPNYPEGYVRFVYCFGYAEHSLLENTTISKKLKLGTPQFWKIFSASISKNEQFNFDAIKKSTTKTDERIRNKINLLKKLRDEGIWLVDSSIVGLYNKGEKPSHREMKEIILISWDNYVKGLIINANPKFIVCIGKFVLNSLEDRIKEIGIPYDFIYQPQARCFSEKDYKKLQQICSKYKNS